jgi:hypothetical protein
MELAGGISMAQLSYPSSTEVQLRLGAQENAILTVVRGWSWWTRADVEGRVPGEPQVTAVILTAARSEDRLIRDILHRSFQLIFPAEGGDGVLTTVAPTARARRSYR